MRKYLILLVALTLAVPAVFAQQPATPAPAMQHHPGQGDSMNCEAMMQKMQTSQKALDDKLQALTEEMNKASGSAKVDRMAAVINELVAQRKQMHSQMMSMMPQMMEHAMHHMQSGMAEGMKDCPMMHGQAEKHEGHH